MDRTVRQHIEWLEARLHTLTNTLMATDRRESANAIETEIRAVNLALGHYRSAVEIEERTLGCARKNAYSETHLAHRVRARR